MWDEVSYPFLTLNGAKRHRLSFSMLFNLLFTTVYHTCRYDSFMICLCYFSELNFWSSILLLVINGAHNVLTDRQYGMHILEIRNCTQSLKWYTYYICVYVCVCYQRKYTVWIIGMQELNTRLLRCICAVLHIKCTNIITTISWFETDNLAEVPESCRLFWCEYEWYHLCCYTLTGAGFLFFLMDCQINFCSRASYFTGVQTRPIEFL